MKTLNKMMVLFAAATVMSTAAFAATNPGSGKSAGESSVECPGGTTRVVSGKADDVGAGKDDKGVKAGTANVPAAPLPKTPGHP